MENLNETLVPEKKAHDGEERRFTLDEERLWIPFGKISWPAIFAGVLVVTVSQMLLSLLGLGIGMSTVDPLTEQEPLRGLGTGTIAWWSGSMLISLFLGGLTTGRMYQTRSKAYLTWHGLLTWCTFTVLSFLMLSTGVGTLISGTGSVIGTVVTAGISAGQNNQLDISSITRDAENLFMSPNMNNANGGTTSQLDNGTTARQNSRQGKASTQPGSKNDQNTSLNSSPRTGVSARTSQPMTGTANNQNMNAQQGMGAAISSNPHVLGEIQNFFTRENSESPESKEALINTLTSQTGMSRAEATTKVNNWVASYEQLKAKAQVKADEAADAVATASIIGFFALLIGAFVTVLGARSAPQREYALVNKTKSEFVRTPR